MALSDGGSGGMLATFSPLAAPRDGPCHLTSGIHLRRLAKMPDSATDSAFSSVRLQNQLLRKLCKLEVLGERQTEDLEVPGSIPGGRTFLTPGTAADPHPPHPFDFPPDERRPPSARDLWQQPLWCRTSGPAGSPWAPCLLARSDSDSMLTHSPSKHSDCPCRHSDGPVPATAAARDLRQ
jgi:hypothetical protein